MEKQKNNTLVAPFDGIIKSVASHLVGNKVEAREVIISMYSEDGFCLRVSNAGDKLRYGMEVSIEVGRAGGKKRYTGVVVSAPNILSSSTSQADAYILVNESVASEDFQKSITYYADTEYLENVLIVVDDLALPVGALRLKGQGSDGGHNGLKHIAETLGTQNYARLRFGIGNDFPRGHQIDYVLGEFTEEDMQTMDERVKMAGDIVKSFCLAGINITMNQYNKK